MAVLGEGYIRIATTALVISLSAIVLWVLTASCGGKNQDGAITVASENKSVNHPSEVTSDNDTEPACVDRAITLKDALQEVRAYEPGGDTGAGVEADVFIQLKDELISQLSSRYDGDFARITSGVPQGTSGQVDDLRIEDGLLKWTYKNDGDYDLSGEVNVADITPIAQNFGAKTDDGIGDDEFESWIDGDGDGEVGISDISVIAGNYLGSVQTYRILSLEDQYSVGSETDNLVEPQRDYKNKIQSVEIVSTIPLDLSRYLRVRAEDSKGNIGSPSKSVRITPGWHIGTVDEECNTNTYISMTIDNTDIPHFFYSVTDGDSGSVFHSKVANGIVEKTVVDSYDYEYDPQTIHRYSLPSIETDSSNILHCMYSECGNYYKEDLIKQSYSSNGSQWIFDSPPDTTFQLVSKIALDPSGNPGFISSDTEMGRVYISYNNATWSSLTLNLLEDEYLKDFDSYICLKIDSDSQPHILYKLGSLGSTVLLYGYLKNNEWIIEEVDYGFCIWISENSLALDSDGSPHIIYYDGYVQGSPFVSDTKMRYAYKYRTGWRSRIIDESSVWNYPSIEVDSEDNPHICGFRSDSTDTTKTGLYYATKNDYEWSVARINSSSRIEYYRNLDLSVDSKGNPYMCFLSYTSNNRYTLHYMWIS